jgi:hypothetical protein
VHSLGIHRRGVSDATLFGFPCGASRCNSSDEQTDSDDDNRYKGNE